jgi:excisionase family DNA binding protein
MPNNPPELLTVAEAARRYSFSQATIRRMIRDKRIPAVRIPAVQGNRDFVRIRRAEADAQFGVGEQK